MLIEFPPFETFCKWFRFRMENTVKFWSNLHKIRIQNIFLPRENMSKFFSYWKAGSFHRDNKMEGTIFLINWFILSHSLSVQPFAGWSSVRGIYWADSSWTDQMGHRKSFQAFLISPLKEIWIFNCFVIFHSAATSVCPFGAPFRSFSLLLYIYLFKLTVLYAYEFN